MKKVISSILSLLLVLCLAGCKAKYDPAPQITEAEFSFNIEYEMNGQRYIIEDTMTCYFAGYDMSNNFAVFGYPYSRSWNRTFKNGDVKTCIVEFEENTSSALVEGRINEQSRIEIYYGAAGYYMGDPDDDYRGPCIRYIEEFRVAEQHVVWEETKLTNEQLNELFGIKVLRFQFSEPIENKFG